MKSLHTLIALAALALSSAPALADMSLASKHACTACHQVAKKVVGPAYADVAKKYAGDKDAVAKLSASIKAGGSGKWGPVPMPPQPNLSDADLKVLASWILDGAK